MQLDYEDELPCTPPDVAEAANAASLSLLPAKSRKIYEKTYEQFLEWCKTKKASSLTENVLLAFFAEKSKCYKPSTLWSSYSMLKVNLIVKNNVDISKYCKLIAFLKRNADGYKPKKSKILRKEEMDRFITDAPDEDYLMIKVALIMGISGACRREELAQLTIDDIQDLETALIVNIRESKTKIQGIITIVDQSAKPSYIGLYRKCALRPHHINHRRPFHFL